MTRAVTRETETLLSTRIEGKGWVMEGVSEGELPFHSFLLLPASLLIHSYLLALSNPLLPRDAHLLGLGGCTHLGVLVCVDWLKKWQNKAEASNMHVRLPGIPHPGTPLLFFSLMLTFLLFFFFLNSIF